MGVGQLVGDLGVVLVGTGLGDGPVEGIKG